MTATTQDTQPGITLEEITLLLSVITPKPLDVQIDEQALRCKQFNNQYTDKAYLLRELSILASLIRLREIEGKLREPSDELLQTMAVAHHHSPCDDLIGPMEDAFNAMSALLLRGKS